MGDPDDNSIYVAILDCEIPVFSYNWLQHVTQYKKTSVLSTELGYLMQLTLEDISR